MVAAEVNKLLENKSGGAWSLTGARLPLYT